MFLVRARNAQTALPELMLKMQDHGVARPSRNGPVVQLPEPTTIVYEKPEERVVFWAERDANPFFHFYESLWMIAGRNDVKPLSKLVARMKDFSDDGQTFHGAYGYRWRRWFGFDQIDKIIETLRNNPDDRRCVLGMWSPADDLGRQGKDFPCNTQAVFNITPDGELNMTVYNRSNDSVLGALGANVVHFSFLQEYVARSIGVPVGKYWQVSANMHLYLREHDKFMQHMAGVAHDSTMERMFGAWQEDPYANGEVAPLPIMSTNRHDWDWDLKHFFDGKFTACQDPFFQGTARPLMAAHEAYRNRNDPERYEKALELAGLVAAPDWRKAATEWLQRRQARYQKANDDGPSYE